MLKIFHIAQDFHIIKVYKILLLDTVSQIYFLYIFLLYKENFSLRINTCVAGNYTNTQLTNKITPKSTTTASNPFNDYLF